MAIAKNLAAEVVDSPPPCILQVLEQTKPLHVRRGFFVGNVTLREERQCSLN